MLEYYLQVKQAHVALVLTSGGLFALRGVMVLGGMSWAMNAPARYASYGIDLALLTSALVLLFVLQLNPFAEPWLGAKLAWLVAYIALGSWALKRARGWSARLFAYVAALACFGFMYSVARTHSALGALLWLPG